MEELKHTHTLTLVETEHDALRARENKGAPYDGRVPTVGERFMFIADPVVAGHPLRAIITSEVHDIEAKIDGTVVFKTENSTYRLEPIRSLH